jgi:hypothetical protein
MDFPFDFPGFRMDFERHARILKMTPLEAARTMLRYDFGIGDESALGYAIRKDPRITLDDDALFDLLEDAEDLGWTPQDLLDVAIDESRFNAP